MSSSHYEYLVIDKRTAHLVPVVGVYFSPDEPVSTTGTSHLPISQASLDKFERYGWTKKVFESDNYIVYRFQFGSLHAWVAPIRP